MPRAGITQNGIDASTVDPARRYDALLGGKDNFAVDRSSAHVLKEAFPSIEFAARENRKFLRRAVRHLASERGVRQFLDIGVGIPASPNVHEVAQDVDPACRILYVDHDPLVAVHARALLTSTPEGAVGFVLADLRDPSKIFNSFELREVLDLSKPVALILAAVLHFCTDADDPDTAVRTLIGALPSGSYVVLSHATFDPLPRQLQDHLMTLAAPGAGHGPFQPRTREQVAKFLDGLDLEDPGLVSTINWHPDHEPTAPVDRDEQDAICYAAVARVP